jgi:DNA-binding transcriptional regulator PaaX
MLVQSMGSWLGMTFQAREEMLDKAEQAILLETRNEVPPVELIKTLKNEGIDEYSIRAAIWILIDDGKIELTRDRKLVSLL